MFFFLSPIFLILLIPYLQASTHSQICYFISLFVLLLIYFVYFSYLLRERNITIDLSLNGSIDALTFDNIGWKHNLLFFSWKTLIFSCINKIPNKCKKHENTKSTDWMNSMLDWFALTLKCDCRYKVHCEYYETHNCTGNPQWIHKIATHYSIFSS